MANVYIEPRPKGRPEGNPTDDYVVEDRADHVLTTYTLYFVIRCREFRKFLQACFCECGGTIYLYLATFRYCFWAQASSLRRRSAAGARKLLRPCRSGLTPSVFIVGYYGKRGWSCEE